jgi:hypothetical protein
MATPDPNLLELIMSPKGMTLGGAVALLVYGWRWTLDYKRGSAKDATDTQAKTIEAQAARIKELEDSETARVLYYQDRCKALEQKVEELQDKLRETRHTLEARGLDEVSDSLNLADAAPSLTRKADG